MGALAWIEAIAIALATGMDVLTVFSVAAGGFKPDWGVYAASAVTLGLCVIGVLRIPHAPNRRYVSIVVACLALCVAGWLPPDGILTFVLSAILAARLTFAFDLRGAAAAWVVACAAISTRFFSAIVGPDHAVLGGSSSLNWIMYFQDVAPTALLLALIFGMIVLMKIYATSSADEATTRERTRIALDLHDFLGHGLTTLRVHLQNVDRHRASDPPKAQVYLERAIASSGELLADIRETVGMLHDDDRLNTLPLPALIERLCNDFASTYETQIDVRLHINCEPSGRIAVTLYRVIQEALTNVARHASAGYVCLTIRGDQDTIEATIEDDGRGLQEQARNGGHGLISMRERITRLSGTFSISPRTGGGTIVRALVPIEASA